MVIEGDSHTMRNDSLGAILRMERLKRNLTQQQVCEAIQISLHTLSNIENGKGVSGKTIKKLTNFYGLRV